MKYGKEVEVEAEQWYPGSEIEGVSPIDMPMAEKPNECPKCKNLMGLHGQLDEGEIVCPCDWIVTAANGIKYPCRPEVFKVMYDKNDGESNDN